ncbi:MAG: hypothetical protein WCN88_01380 [Candidatus Falkowbacteria bacterium]
MRSVLFIVVILALSASASFAQSVETFLKFNSDGKIVNNDANISFSVALAHDSTNFMSKMKFTTFILVEPEWGEQMFGLSYAPAPWVEVGLAAGFEQAPRMFRGCATLWLGKGKFSSFTAFERGIGKDNWWIRNITKYQTSDKLALGFQGWRYNGIGPLIEYKVVNHISVYGNPVWNPEAETDAATLIVGLWLNF